MSLHGKSTSRVARTDSERERERVSAQKTKTRVTKDKDKRGDPLRTKERQDSLRKKTSWAGPGVLRGRRPRRGLYRTCRGQRVPSTRTQAPPISHSEKASAGQPSAFGGRREHDEKGGEHQASFPVGARQTDVGLERQTEGKPHR